MIFMLPDENEINEQERKTKDCICNLELARVYVKIQEIKDVFEPSEGLANGTIFPELVL
jgi:hypothetical protein